MTKLPAAAFAVILCAPLLAACGDSGTTSSTKTATVPSGKLGDSGRMTCPAPRGARVVFRYVTATKISCAEAGAAVVTVYRTGSYPGFDCRKSTNTVDCTKKDDPATSFSGEWSFATMAPESGSLE